MKLLYALGLLSLYFALVLAQNSTDVSSTEAAPDTTVTTDSPEIKNASSTAGQQTTTTAEVTTAHPGPPAGDLYYVNDGGVVCILLSVKMDFNVTYDKTDNTNDTIKVHGPSNTTATTAGSCKDKDEWISLTWVEKNTHFNVRMNFMQDSSEQYVKDIIFEYTLTDGLFPEANRTGENIVANVTNKFFEVSTSNQYLCKSNTTVVINKDVSMLTRDLNLQAFRKANDTDFRGDRQQCPADAETNNIVPIAVGAALAALVVIVLIAYLISRNRNKGGYESV